MKQYYNITISIHPIEKSKKLKSIPRCSFDYETRRMLSKDSLCMSTQISQKVISASQSGTGQQSSQGWRFFFFFFFFFFFVSLFPLFFLQESEEMRRTYLKIVRQADWKEQFMLIARHVAKATADSMPVSPMRRGEDEGFSIAHGERLFSNFENADAVIVGRIKDCDVTLRHEACSRVHAIFLLLPTKVVCVDVGSALGIITTRRSGDHPCESSLPNQRAVLIFDWGECVVLGMGKEQLCLNPRLCCICLDRPRTVLFSCKHFVCCSECAPKVKHCPVCRCALENVKAVEGEFFVNSRPRE